MDGQHTAERAQRQQHFDIKDHARTWTERVRREILACHAARREFDAKEFKLIQRKLRAGGSILPGEPVGPTQAEIDANTMPCMDWTLRQACPLAQKRIADIQATDLTEWIAARTKPRKVKLVKWQDQYPERARILVHHPERHLPHKRLV